MQFDTGGHLLDCVRKAKGIGAKGSTCLISVTESPIIFSTEILSMNKKTGVIQFVKFHAFLLPR